MLKTTLEQWRMFKAVVNYGGFNQAAQAIHKSQSTIHHAVHKLEENLNLKLLEIKGRKAFLTQAGELMLRRANYLLDEAAKMEAVAGTMSAGIETSFTLAVDEAFPSAALYDVIEVISAQYPFLRVESMETILSGANELLQQGTVDIALSPQPLNDGFSEEIYLVEFIAVAHPKHALHQLGHSLTYDDLKIHRQIVVRDSAIHTKKDEGWLGSNQRWTVSHIHTSIDLVSKGFGFAWLPINNIQNYLTSDQLLPLPLMQGAKRSAQIYLQFNDADRLGPAAKAFIGELRYILNSKHFFS